MDGGAVIIIASSMAEVVGVSTTTPLMTACCVPQSTATPFKRSTAPVVAVLFDSVVIVVVAVVAGYSQSILGQSGSMVNIGDDDIDDASLSLRYWVSFQSVSSAPEERFVAPRHTRNDRSFCPPEERGAVRNVTASVGWVPHLRSLKWQCRTVYDSTVRGGVQ